MTAVHVIVTEDAQVVEYWKQAFAGAVDVYAFASNVETYERLLAARAPIDLLLITPNQSGVFNLGADQLVERLARQPLAGNANVSGMRVLVVGQSVTSARAESVGSLEAAVRLVKFGEVEQAPQPQSHASGTVPAAGTAPAAVRPAGGLVESLISSMWDAPADAPASQPQQQPYVAAEPAQAASQFRTDVEPLSAAAPQLFIRAPYRPRPDDGVVGGGGPATADTPAAEVVPVEPSYAAAATPAVMPMGGIMIDPLLGWSADTQQEVAAHSAPMPAMAAMAPAMAAAPTAAHVAPVTQAHPAPIQQGQPMPYGGPQLPVSNAMPVGPDYGDAATWPAHQPAAHPAASPAPAQAPAAPAPPATPGGVFDAPPDLLSRLDDDGVNFG